MPGWYPDPGGRAGRFRFWDGQSWSEQTTSDPLGTPAPTPPSGPASGKGSSRGWIVALLVLGLVTLLIVLGLFWLTRGSSPWSGGVSEDTNSSTPTIPAWDETSSATPPPTGGSLVSCPVTAVDTSTRQNDSTVLKGGGLIVNRIDGWRTSPMYLQWVSDFQTQMDTVHPGWMSNIGVGALNHVDGFVEPRVAAVRTLECFASSGYYLDFTGRSTTLDQAVTIDGHPGWRIRAEVRVAIPELPQVAGDVVDIIVVDLGPGADHLGTFISSFTIGDTPRQAKVEAAIASLRVA